MHRDLFFLIVVLKLLNLVKRSRLKDIFVIFSSCGYLSRSSDKFNQELVIRSLDRQVPEVSSCKQEGT